MILTFRIVSDTATEAIGLAGRIASSAFAKEAAGNGVRKIVISHLDALGPNKRFPAASTGFYHEAAESTSAPVVTETGAEISIDQEGFRQRLLGGHIVQNTPGKTYLTIPGVALSYGRLAPEFDGLKFTYARNEDGFMAPALAATDLLALGGSKPKRVKGVRRPVLEAGDIVYWLVRQVNQNPDPSVLPSDDEMIAGAIAELGDLVRAWLDDPNAELVLAS